MTEIPKIIPEVQSILLSPTFTEFATGRGIIELFLGKSSGSNRMSNIAFYSDKINFIGIASTGTTLTTSIDEDFDIKFLKTVVIDGEAIFNIPVGMTGDTAGGNYNYIVTINVRKFDGSTETEISNAVGTTISEAVGSDDEKSFLSTINVNITNTTFNVGDSLRVSIKITVQRTSGSGTSQAALIADPKGRVVNTLIDAEIWTIGTANRDLDWATIAQGQGTAVTICTAQIPFRVDI